MKTILSVALLLFVLSPAVRAHNETFPLKPRRISGGKPGAVPTPPSRGTESPDANGDPAAERPDWERWWRRNRHAIIDLDALRRARRERARLPAVIAPGHREAALVELRAAASENDEMIAAAALLALGRAADREALDLLSKRAAPAGERTIREAAILGLGLLGAPARDALLERFSAQDSPRIRAVVALALGLTGEVSAVPALARRARKSEPFPVPSACLIALAAIGSDFPRAADAPAAFSAFAAGRIGDGEAVNALRRALRRKESAHRRQAALSLGLLPVGPAAKKDLRVLATGQPDATLRAYAAVSLSRVGGGDVAETLDRALRKGDGGVRPFAALAIGILSRRDPERPAVPLLRNALSAENSPDTKAAIALGLALAADEASIPALRECLTAFDSVPLRGHAAVALAILGDRESREGIRRLLDASVPPSIQREAALAAGLVTDPDLEKELVERLLEGETELSRGTAAVALGRMRAIDAAGVLTRILRDRGNPAALRALTAEALGRVLASDGTPPETRLTSGLHLPMVPPPLAEVIRSL